MKLNQFANARESAMCNTELDIRSRIFTIRGVQVMLDRDIAELYQVPTKRLNEQVKRNADRFPDRYMFQLTKADLESLRSQIATSNSDMPESLRSQFATSKRGGVRYLPYVFSEHGITMLASVLNSAMAIAVSVRIIDTFVAMRKALASMAPMLSRIEAVERRQITDQAKNDANQAANEARFDQIFDAMQDKSFPPQKIFYDGQVYDAKAFATKHILSAAKSIFLIDSWVDVATLEMLAKKKPDVMVEIVTSPRGNRLAASDIAAFNAQYGGLAIRTSTAFHDRFLIVDDKRLYLLNAPKKLCFEGEPRRRSRAHEPRMWRSDRKVPRASLKDLGKKCFAFTKLDPVAIPVLKTRAEG